MKKLLSVMLLLVLVLGVTVTSAQATVYFTLNNVQTTSETGPVTYYNRYEWKTIKEGYLYVDHSVIGGTNAYTNLFHAVRLQLGNNILCGQKWATTGVNVPIQSNAIYLYYDYTVAARGNTKHFTLDGISSITLTGNFNPNHI